MKEMIDERINELFEELVPMSGKAESMAGELVRATCRIGYRWLNDGDRIAVLYGNETCNAAARFLGVNGTDDVARIVGKMWNQFLSDDEYEELLDELTLLVSDMVEEDPSLRTKECDDMFSYREDEDFDWDEEEDDDDWTDWW